MNELSTHLIVSNPSHPTRLIESPNTGARITRPVPHDGARLCPGVSPENPEASQSSNTGPELAIRFRHCASNIVVLSCYSSRRVGEVALHDAARVNR